MRNSKPYLIAEIGVNFYDTARVMDISPLEAAKLYIDKAAEAGIDCAKFQSYKAGTIVSKNSPAYWDTTKEPTRTQYELFLKHDSFGEMNTASFASIRIPKALILPPRLLTMHQQIIWKIWLIFIRLVPPIYPTCLLSDTSERKGNRYFCL